MNNPFGLPAGILPTPETSKYLAGISVAQPKNATQFRTKRGAVSLQGFLTKGRAIRAAVAERNR